jgi:hypothetical protein
VVGTPLGGPARPGRDRARWLRPTWALALVLALSVPSIGPGSPSAGTSAVPLTSQTAGPVANFTASINRLVELVAVAGSGLLALVWVRVALSWFSNDITKKVQAKDRARDALIGTLLFVAAITGLVWGLAQWVLTGV